MNQIFRDYQLVTQLSRKAFSCLYLAQPIAASTENVVIRIFDSISADFAQEHFQKEINQITHLRHPFILPLHSGGIEQGHPYLVSGYAPSDSLRNRIMALQSRPFPLAKALLTIVQLGQALGYAHAWNILHTNIKPENVLFNAQDQALLADFIPSSLTKDYLSRQQPDLQSARYKAPEQLAGTESMESDQYALGCIAYEILTGQSPFTVIALSTGQLKRTSEHPTPLTQIIPGLPQHVDVAVCKALANEPRTRHASVAAFMEALTAYSLKITTASSPESMMSARSMDELEASSLQPPRPTNVQNNQLQRPFSEKSGLAILPASNPKENVAMPVGAGGSNTTSATMLASSPMPVMPPPLIPQTPHYLRNVSPEVDANAQWKPLAEKRMHMRRRKGLVVGIGIAISFICLLLLGVSVLPLLLPKSDTKQGLGQTPTIPAVTATQTHRTPTAQPSIQPTATATHEVKPTPTATPSPTPSPTKPPPTPTPPPSTPTPKPTHTPKPTPTPCWLFC